MQRTTQALVEVWPLFCDNPSYGTDTRVGIAVPMATNIISADLSVFDNDSHGWTGPQHRPNMTWRREDFNDLGGLKFVGFYIDNRDENLRRLLHATIVWDGVGEDLAQSEGMTVHGCNRARRNSNVSPDTKTIVKAGLLIPSGQTLVGGTVEVRESNGAWTANLPEIGLQRLSTQPAPGLPGYTWALTQLENRSRSRARALRVRGTIR